MAKLAEMDGPVNDSGWSLTVVDAASPETIMGDLYVGIEWGGRSAEVGYTFWDDPDHWGKGYATEATQATIHYLFADFGVSRVRATLHPDNPASARVLEACGMTYEGRTIVLDIGEQAVSTRRTASRRRGHHNRKSSRYR